MSRKPPQARYNLDELIAITDEWEAFAARRDKRWILVRLMDTLRALGVLSEKQKQAVFLIGLCQMRQKDAAVICNVSRQAVGKRYQRGLENMAHYLNGESYTK